MSTTKATATSMQATVASLSPSNSANASTQKSPSEAAKPKPTPLFLLHAGAAKAHKSEWFQISEKKATPNSWRENEARKETYPLVTFTVWLCVEFGILSLEDDLMFKQANLDGWTGESPVVIATMSGVHFTANAMRVWKIWGKPQPRDFKMNDNETEPSLFDFLFRALNELWTPASAYTKRRVSTITLDIRKWVEIEHEKWPNNSSTSRNLFGRYYPRIRQVCIKDSSPKSKHAQLDADESQLLLRSLNERANKQDQTIRLLQDELRSLKEEQRKRDARERDARERDARERDARERDARERDARECDARECESEQEIEVIALDDSLDDSESSESAERATKRHKPDEETGTRCSLM